MKKIKKIMVSLLTMTLLMSTTAFAATATELRADLKTKLEAAGVPATYAQHAINCLETVDVTEEKIDKAMAYVEEAQALIAKGASREELLVPAQNAAKVFGLTVEFGSNNTVIVKKGTTTILTLSVSELKEVVKNVDVTKLKEAIKVAAEYSVTYKSENSGKKTPSTTPMKNTATNNANVLFAGLGLMVVAGGVFFVSKKVTA